VKRSLSVSPDAALRAARGGALAVLILTALLLAACGAAEETPSGVSGAVRDRAPFGGTTPLAGVEVVCRDTESAAETRTQTDAEGRFFLALEPGRYELSYASGSNRVWVPAPVEAGRVTALEPFVGLRYDTTGFDAAPFKERFRPLTRELGLARGSALLAVTGASAAMAAGLFGPAADLAPETPVWVCVLAGELEGAPASAAARDLARGGAVAYELDAETLETLAVVSAPSTAPFEEWASSEDCGPTHGFPVY